MTGTRGGNGGAAVGFGGCGGGGAASSPAAREREVTRGAGAGRRASDISAALVSSVSRLARGFSTRFTLRTFPEGVVAAAAPVSS